jgi:hypothetical protein
MAIISELLGDAKTMVAFRLKYNKMQKSRDQLAPKKGDLAPDFTLSTIDGSQSISLSDFRFEKPVVLIFGSFT